MDFNVSVVNPVFVTLDKDCVVKFFESEAGGGCTGFFFQELDLLVF